MQLWTQMLRFALACSSSSTCLLPPNNRRHVDPHVRSVSSSVAEVFLPDAAVTVIIPVEQLHNSSQFADATDPSLLRTALLSVTFPDAYATVRRPSAIA